MTVSAAWPLDKAIAASVIADSALVAGGSPLLNATKPVHSGQPPAGALLDYLVLGETGETPFLHMNGQDGNEDGLDIKIWTTDLSKKSGLLIYAELKRLLDGVALVLAGHTVVYGRLTLFTGFLDDGVPPARCTVARYRVLSKAA